MPASAPSGANGSPRGGERWRVALAPGTVFLVLGGLFGLFFAVATPPHDPPDEMRHHARVWLISQGRLRVVGLAPDHRAAIPGSILELHSEAHHYDDEQMRSGPVAGLVKQTTPHDPAELGARLRGPPARGDLRRVVTLTPYNPAVYAPYVPALWVARRLDLSAAAGLLLARLTGLACWLAGIWAALRIAPCQRWLLAAVALLPLSVFQGASVSADPPTQVVIFWFLAEWLRAATRSEPRDLNENARLVAAAYALGMVKPGYGALALACFALPGALGLRLALGTAALAAAALPTLLWASVVRAAEEPPMMGADVDAQLRFILTHPLAFLAAAGRTVGSLFVPLVSGMVGFLGHFDVEIPRPATALGLAAVSASASLGRGTLPLRARLVLFGVFLAASLAVITLAYLGWTPVGAPHVQSIQPRYFLLVLPFALVLLPRIPRITERALAVAVTASLAVVLAVSAVAMVRTYYAF